MPSFFVVCFKTNVTESIRLRKSLTGTFAAQLKVTIRFKRDFTDRMFRRALVAGVGRHYTDREWTVFYKDDARISPNILQVTGFIGHLHAGWQIVGNVTLLQRR